MLMLMLMGNRGMPRRGTGAHVLTVGGHILEHLTGGCGRRALNAIACRKGPGFEGFEKDSKTENGDGDGRVDVGVGLWG